MKVLDLFAGLRGWSQAFVERGHDVRTLELDPRFPGITYRMDARAFTAAHLGDWRPDLVLASPPCTGFSVMRIGANWHHDGTPKTETARLGLDLVRATLRIIEELRPAHFIIENPRAKLRALPILAHVERRTVTYCQYGERRMKPTDLWGLFPSLLVLKSPCVNGAPCHVRAPRGSTTGTQGMDSAESARVPYLLSLAVCQALELES